MSTRNQQDQADAQQKAAHGTVTGQQNPNYINQLRVDKGHRPPCTTPKQTQLKQTRKDVAELLRANKEGNARIRVETVIRETLMLQAYDILELFLELLAVRVQLVEKSKQIPPDMLEALSSIVYASANISDIPELPNIRNMLGSKFGKEFVQGASALETNRMWHVNENLLRY